MAIIDYDKGQIIFGVRIIPFENTRDNARTPVKMNDDKAKVVVTITAAENGEIRVTTDNDDSGIKSRSVKENRGHDYGFSEK